MKAWYKINKDFSQINSSSPQYRMNVVIRLVDKLVHEHSYGVVIGWRYRKTRLFWPPPEKELHVFENILNPARCFFWFWTAMKYDSLGPQLPFNVICYIRVQKLRASHLIYCSGLFWGLYPEPRTFGDDAQIRWPKLKMHYYWKSSGRKPFRCTRNGVYNPRTSFC